MTTTVEAIYEDGKLILQRPLLLPEKSRVRVTIESDPGPAGWLTLSEPSSAKPWGHTDDEVFSQLSTMADDPQIQRELRSINRDFSAAESDGLDKV